MREERPIVFTISKFNSSYYSVSTLDPRGKEVELSLFNTTTDLYGRLLELSEILNNKGYAVLFEVD